MYDVWVNQENPSIHLVMPQGAPLPESSGTPMLNWSLLGTVQVTPVVAAIVDSEGVAEVVSVVPFDPQGVFGPEGQPAGAQNEVPR